MAFGTQYEFNPVPKRIGMLLVAFPNTGKSSLAAQLVKDGKLGVVIDADGRFDEVVTEGVRFVPLSDEPSDMINPEKIHKIMHKNMPNDDVGLILVDSVTAIIEPIILDVQLHGTGARSYKNKADAMKLLQAAITPWGKDNVFVYHYREFGDTKGQMHTGTSITRLELARLYRNINIEAEIVVDDDGRRGLKVLFARGGRTGMTLWDDSGLWLNFRQRIEDEVWGGLTQTEQKTLVEQSQTGTFNSSAEAISWGWEFSQENGGFFNDAQHAKNSFTKLYKELKEELGDEATAEVAYVAWVDKVKEKANEGS